MGVESNPPTGDWEQPALGAQITDAERAHHNAATLEALEALEAPNDAASGVASLFVHGVDLCARTDSPALALLIAHVGREITRGIVDILMGPRVDRVRDEEGETKAAFKVLLATVLEVQSDDPVVQHWFELHNKFVASVHFRTPLPEAQQVREVFAEYAEFLYGFVGPFYDTQVEIDALADVRFPTKADVSRLTQRLSRRAQRQRFFSRASGAWIEPLDHAQFFRTPPERRVEPDGSWRVTPWPEGSFLARVADTHPAEVAAVLRRLPRTILNPAVWNSVANAATILPVEEAATLGALCVQALKTAPPVIFPHTLVDVVHRLADGGRREAFRIAEALLWSAALPNAPIRHEGEDEQAYIERMHEDARGLLLRDDWLLARIDADEFSRFVSVAIPPLLRLDGARTLQLLVTLVRRIESMLQSLEARLSAPGEEVAPGKSRRWSQDLIHNRAPHPSLLEQLANATTSVALSLASASIDGAASALVILENGNTELFDRVKIVVLAGIGSQVPEALDRAILDSALLSPPYGAAEVAHLLRSQFASASPGARRALADAVIGGPEPGLVEQRLRFWGLPETDEEKDREIVRWQARRLRWFHEQIPAELADLASRIGISGNVPTYEQQSLDEIGSWSGPARWLGERTPIEVEDLAAMSAGEALSFLSTWQPSTNGMSVEGVPTRVGLERTILTLASLRPAVISAWAKELPLFEIRADYVHAVLSGLQQAIANNRSVDPKTILTFAASAFALGESVSASTESDTGRSLGACIEAAIILEGLALRANLAWDDGSELLTTLGMLSNAALRRFDERSEKDNQCWKRDVVSGWTSLAGRLLNAAVGLAASQRHHSSETIETPCSFPPTTSLTLFAERLLKLDGFSGAGVRSALGARIPTLYWLCPSWAETYLVPEIEGFFDPSSRSPTFPAYLAQSKVFDEAFKWLRPWYLRAVRDDSVIDMKIYESVTVGGLLVRHVSSGVVAGLCRPGDSDGLAELAFARATTEDLDRTYWEIFRAWTDAQLTGQRALQWLEAASRRVLELWNWRLSEIDSRNSKDAAGEANALLWLLAAPHLPVSETVALGIRTISHLGTTSRNLGSVWQRLRTLADVDPAGAFELTERVVLQMLATGHLYVPADRVTVILSAALQLDDNWQRRARRLINTLGENGHGEFEPLYWSPDSVH